MNWRLVAVGATLIPVIIIVLRFDIQIQDVLAIGAVPFTLAVLVMITKLGIQGAKFAYIAQSYMGNADQLVKLAGVRIGSEFIKFSTPMFVGAEIIMIYYLHKKKVPASMSAWIALVDIVTEVLAAGALSMLAGLLAIWAGFYFIGALVLAVSIPITAIWGVLFFLSSQRTFRIPNAIRLLVSRVSKAKGSRYIDEADKWLLGICNTSREYKNSKKSTKVLINAFLMSLASWTMYGISFLIIAVGVGYHIEIFDSVMAVMAANAIANLPITVGGSGLTELGIFAYLNNANPFDFAVVHGGVEWNAIVGWRIATYYIPLVITWLLLVKLALSKVTRSDIEERQ